MLFVLRVAQALFLLFSVNLCWCEERRLFICYDYEHDIGFCYSPDDIHWHPKWIKVIPYFRLRNLGQRYGSGGFHSLNQASAYELLAHSSTGTRSKITFPSHCLGAQYGFTFYFITHLGFFSPFSHRITSLWPMDYSGVYNLARWSLLIHMGAISHSGVFSLARWSLLIHTGFHVPRVLV